MIFINNQLDLESIKNPRKCVDFFCKINDDYIGIEMNNNPSMAKLERNISYALETYKRETAPGKNRYNFKKVIQININNFKFDITEEAVENYKIRSNKGKDFTNKIEIICISLSLIKEKLYNKDKLTELEKFLLVANEEDEGLVKNLSKGSEIMKEYEREAKKVSNEEEVLDLYSYERKILAEKAEAVDQGLEQGRQEGIKEGIIETAKKFLKEKVDISIISKCTGLSEKEIQELAD